MTTRRSALVVLPSTCVQLLCGAFVSGSVALGAEQIPKVWRIGVLGVGIPGVGVVTAQRPNISPGASTPGLSYLPSPALDPRALRNAAIYLNWLQFVRELQRLGYEEGRNVVFVERIASDASQSLEYLAGELVKEHVDVIIAASGTLGALAARRATSTVPIVMFGSSDAVADGISTNLARPGSNITGNSVFGWELGVKRLQLLTEAIGKPICIAHLSHSSSSSMPNWVAQQERMEVAAKEQGVHQVVFEAIGSKDDLEAAFSRFQNKEAKAIVVDDNPYLTAIAPYIVMRTVMNRMPGIAGPAIYANAGLLMAYGINAQELGTQAARYVDKLLKGAKPEDLPIEQSTKFELIINERTASALGVIIPPSILVRADRVVNAGLFLVPSVPAPLTQRP